MNNESYDDMPQGKLEEQPTAHQIEDKLDNLIDAITRFERALDKFEGSNIPEDVKECAEKAQVTVASTWKSAPGRIYKQIERIHKNVDRLEHLFS